MILYSIIPNIKEDIIDDTIINNECLLPNFIIDMQINNEDKVNKLKSAVDINLHNIKSITVRDVIIEDFVNLCVFFINSKL
ncbi:hypothetical protein SFB3_308G2 [Candidatus Arthromitus sp. SFB-3]|nr:hypothetical protein SFB3_308G2 [Candidatus Arthromitus sp. SFB-3]